MITVSALIRLYTICSSDALEINYFLPFLCGSQLLVEYMSRLGGEQKQEGEKEGGRDALCLEEGQRHTPRSTYLG